MRSISHGWPLVLSRAPCPCGRKRMQKEGTVAGLPFSAFQRRHQRCDHPGGLPCFSWRATESSSEIFGRSHFLALRHLAAKNLSNHVPSRQKSLTKEDMGPTLTFLASPHTRHRRASMHIYEESRAVSRSTHVHLQLRNRLAHPLPAAKNSQQRRYLWGAYEPPLARAAVGCSETFFPLAHIN